MSMTLRAVLIVISVLVTGAVVGRIRKSKMQTDDAIFWVLFSFLLIVLALCPPLLFFFTSLLGIASPANLLFLAVIGVLFLKVFSMSVQLSLTEEKLRKLAQDLALRDLEERERSAGSAETPEIPGSAGAPESTEVPGSTETPGTPERPESGRGV